MTDNQVALSRMTRGAPNSLSKATRQAVPPFLQKLYEMVSDSATDTLIRWSENGDSFFVLDHERVAHDVLPRWFKHSNFASFVRQLNMYGFHKIPHLQQGVLRSETETEIWNFEHPNFRRGQPDLLCLITRKKQAQERQGEDTPMLEREGAPAGLPPAGLNQGSLVDINSIINGIAAIKRHQSTISADLNDLKTSNQHLWQEALEARERHQKQQDTINRILKFLAGVFGNATAHKTSPGHTSPHAGIPRKRQRLMIEGNSHPTKETPLEPLDGDEQMNESDESPQSNRFIEVSPSPAPAKTPASAPAAPEVQTPTSQFPPQSSTTADVVMGGNFANQSPFIPFSTNSIPGSDNSGIPSSYPHATDPNNTTALTSTGSASQELLQSIVNSPGSLQRLLNMLNLQQQQLNIPMPPPLDLNAPNADESNGFSNGDFDPYSPFQQSSDPTLSVPENFDIVEPDSQTMSLLHTDEMPTINFEPFIENANKLKKTSDASSVITDHVNMMDSNIESLCKHLGLDPYQFEAMREDGTFGGEAEDDGLFPRDQMNPLPTPSDSAVPNPSAGLDPNTGGYAESDGQAFQSTIPDFDFTAFINELSRQNNGNSGGAEFGDFNPVEREDLEEKQPDSTTSPKLSAFVDEVASQSGQSNASSPPMTRATIQDDPDATPTTVASPEREKKTRKRKSDVEPPNGERIQVKSKRKR